MTEKQVVPKYVADWIEYCKDNKFFLLGALSPIGKFGESLANDFKGEMLDVMDWIRDNQDEFAKAWLNGYEAEKDTKYTVRIKGVRHSYAYLKYNGKYNYWYFSDATVGINFNVYHTKEDLKKPDLAGYSLVMV